MNAAEETEVVEQTVTSPSEDALSAPKSLPLRLPPVSNNNVSNNREKRARYSAELRAVGAESEKLSNLKRQRRDQQESSREQQQVKVETIALERVTTTTSSSRTSVQIAFDGGSASADEEFAVQNAFMSQQRSETFKRTSTTSIANASYELPASMEPLIEQNAHTWLCLPSSSNSHSSDAEANNLLLSSSRRFVIGVSDAQARRAKMEDAIVIHGKYGGRDDFDLLCLFDGHGGDGVANKAAALLPSTLQNILASRMASTKSSSSAPVISPVGKGNKATVSLASVDVSDMDVLKQDVVAAFEAVQQSLESSLHLSDSSTTCGSTALMAFFCGDKLILGNLGDSRALGILPDGTAVRLTVDHKPTVETERDRIEKAGGFVARGRVCSVLGVSRAFGDFFLKPMVSHIPDVTVHCWRDYQSFVFACDGIWDVLSDETVASIVNSTIDPREASRRLRNAAIAAMSTDNITVCIVCAGEERKRKKSHL